MNDASWLGYLRFDGRKGIRNLVLVVYTVECASHVAHAIARDEPDAHVVGFPGRYDNAYAVRRCSRCSVIVLTALRGNRPGMRIHQTGSDCRSSPAH